MFKMESNKNTKLPLNKLLEITFTKEVVDHFAQKKQLKIDNYYFRILLAINQFGISVTFPSRVFSTEYLSPCSISENFKILKSFVLRSVLSKWLYYPRIFCFYSSVKVLYQVNTL